MSRAEIAGRHFAELTGAVIFLSCCFLDFFLRLYHNMYSLSRVEQLQNARAGLKRAREEQGPEGRILNHKGSHDGPFGFDPDCLLFETKSGPRERKKKQIFELEEKISIINSVMDMWKDYDPSILSNIFETLKTVLSKIELVHGGNSFKQPHNEK